MLDKNYKTSFKMHQRLIIRGVKKEIKWPGTVAHTCKPSILGGWGGLITWGQEFGTSPQHGETPTLLKIQKLARCGGRLLQSQVLRKLRQENHLNPGGRGCSELRSHHCTPTLAKQWNSVSKTKPIKMSTKCPLTWQPGHGGSCL